MTSLQLMFHLYSSVFASFPVFSTTLPDATKTVARCVLGFSSTVNGHCCRLTLSRPYVSRVNRLNPITSHLRQSAHSSIVHCRLLRRPSFRLKTKHSTSQPPRHRWLRLFYSKIDIMRYSHSLKIELNLQIQLKTAHSYVNDWFLSRLTWPIETSSFKSYTNISTNAYIW